MSRGQPRPVTIERVEGAWPDPGPGATRLIRRVHDLRRAPIRELRVEDLRILVSQRVSVTVLRRRVMAELDEDPLVSGDLHPGDLLVAVLRAAVALELADRGRLSEVVERIDPGESARVPAEAWREIRELVGRL
ncbi:contact-dependent growth inhibition system immunity protein [Nocardia rhizosphaerae]|uniref:Contact-dependent growth inhibition system immunity protein n=1 Tax=Nocardia rhizosphaerae TaxID=1691571 RepID=A0ABV8L2E3_9NOCA